MNKIKILSLGALMTAQSLLFAAPEVNVGGTFLGGLNVLRQENRVQSRDQFDYAANLDLEVALSERLEAVIQLQMSPGSGALGFPGPAAEVTDLNITYSCDKSDKWMTFGSFDTPFGQQVPFLSNNADTFSNALILNPLLYSALAGPMGTLNTLGLMSYSPTKYGDITVAVTNGTDESASNPDGRFETVVSYKKELGAGRWSLGGSVMSTHDRSDSGSGFNADLDAAIIDLHVNPNESWSFKTYFAQLNYEDGAATDDRVNAWSVEGKWTSQYTGLSIASRISAWQPQDSNGDRSPNLDGEGNRINGLPNPGMSVAQNGVAPVVDQNVIRYELGVTYGMAENMQFKAEVFYDQYDKKTAGESTNTPGALSYVNIAF